MSSFVKRVSCHHPAFTIFGVEHVAIEESNAHIASCAQLFSRTHRTDIVGDEQVPVELKLGNNELAFNNGQWLVGTMPSLQL